MEPVKITMQAGVNLSANQYHFVVQANDGQIDPVAAAGGSADGILYDKPDAAGKAAAVAIFGICRVKAGVAITNGAEVASDALGKAKPATTGNRILGRALEAAGADGDVIKILFRPSTTAP